MKKLILLSFLLIAAAGLEAQNLTGKIVFSRHNGTGPSSDSIFALNNDGKTLTFITHGYRPRVSHNGKMMAFSNGPNKNSSYDADLYLRDLVTQHDTLILSNGADYLDYYDFSPNDSQLVYSQSCSMYTVNIDGTSPYHDINCAPCDCYSDDPTVRISDSSIAYHNVHYGVYTKKFDGSNAAQVPHTYAGDLYPVWSPDGQYIAFEKSGAYSSYYVYNLFKIKPDGSDSTQLTYFANTDTLAPDAIWASDQQSLFFIARLSGVLGIYQVQADGSGSFKLLHDFPATGSVFDYWMGLADSISSTGVVVDACDSVSANFSHINTGPTYYFTDESVLNNPDDIYWHWDFDDDGDTSNQRNPQHYFYNNGNHNVCLTIKVDVSGKHCEKQFCESITSSGSTAGIVDIANIQLSLYPNPSSGSFIIQSSVPLQSYMVYNALGQKLTEEKYHAPTIILPNMLTAGTYFIHFKTNEGTLVKKLILQK